MFVLVAGAGFGASDAVTFVGRAVGVPVVGSVSVVGRGSAWVGLEFSNDDGTSWTGWQPSRPDPEEFLDVDPYGQQTFFLTAKKGWLSGVKSVWSTQDGGATWRRQLPGHVVDVAFAGEAGWMAAGGVRMIGYHVAEDVVRNYVTADGGRTWRACAVPWKWSKVAPLGGASFIGSGTGWITVAKYDSLQRPARVGVARSRDGGCTWKVVWWQGKGASGVPPTGIQFVDARLGWLTAKYGAILQTQDGGVHWSRVTLPAERMNLEGAYLVDRTHAWIVGSAVRGLALYSTSDLGATWTSISEADFLARRGLASEIPRSWGAAFLARMQIASAARSQFR